MFTEDHRPKSHTPAVLRSVTDLVEITGKLESSSVVIAGGHRSADLRLVESARDHGIVDRIILVGRKDMVSEAVERVGIDLDPRNIIGAEDDEGIAAATVSLIRDGGADIVLKGGISTPVINRQMLKVATRPTVSTVSIFEAAPIAEGRPMILTDAGVTTVCNFGRMVNLVQNAVEVAQVVMGIERPRVAVLSANEKQIASLPSTWMGMKLTERSWPNAVVYGPLSFDLAVDAKSVLAKKLPDIPQAGEVAGRADILVCPSIDSANVLYKAIMAMTKYGQASIAGITVGLPVPYIILSRADSLETRLLSVALCSIYAQQTRAKRVETATTPIHAPGRKWRVLAVNPGSTSIKLALYENERAKCEEEWPWQMPSLSAPDELKRQTQSMTELATEMLERRGGGQVDAVAARGGFLPRPPDKIQGGTYVVAEVCDGEVSVERGIVDAIVERAEKEHASNLGIPVAAALAERLRVPAYVVDPVVVDEFSSEAEVSGYAPIVRRSASHALSIRAAARKAADSIGLSMTDICLVVAHLGGGITVAGVRRGRMIDNSIALLGGGPFTPQRAGTLPMGELIDLCYSGKFTRAELVTEMTKRAGLQSYVGEHRMEEIEKLIASGDREAGRAVEAMIYQIAKEIGAMYVAVGSDVEAIVLTGGLTHSKRVRDGVRHHVRTLAPVLVFQGSLEMAALAAGAVEVLSGKSKPRRYSPS
jgi:butyrate kinase